MDNLKSLLISLWINVKNTISKAAAFIIDPNNYNNQKDSLRKAQDCLRRTKDAYLSLTGFPVNNLVTPYSIDRIVRMCHSYSSKEEFANALEHAGATDELYRLLLAIAIFEVYKSDASPKLSSTCNLLLK